ncbi:CopG family transcriptional regulator [Ligilactobacillus sp. LYQ139]|uniref:ribbon-helix-helix domain-containing protein n=1 Tax=Ligilactobacillus sp. LYQ139 TaxID=3378800 RepID=UPI003853592B
MTKQTRRTIWLPLNSWVEFKRLAESLGTTPSNIIKSLIFDMVEDAKKLQEILRQNVPEEQQKQRALYVVDEQWNQLQKFSRQAKISRPQVVRKMIAWKLAHTTLPKTVLKQPKKRFRITLSEDLWKCLNHRAKQMDRTVSSIIEEALRESHML